MDELSEESDDDDLAQAMAEGQERALEIVLRRYGPEVKGWLWSKYANLLREQDGHELLTTAFNDALEKIWFDAIEYDKSRGTLGGWLLYIAQHKVLDILKGRRRHQKRYTQAPEDFDPSEDCSLSDNTPLPKSVQRAVAELDNIIETKLKGNQRAIIKADLAAAEGIADNQWLAEQLGSTPESIMVSRNKAMKNLKKYVMESESLKERYRGK